MRRLLTAITVFALASACGDAGATSSVDMTSAQRFDPEAIEVQAGNELTFTNGSDEAHTVTAYQESIPDNGEYFASGGFDDESSARESLADALIDPGDSFVIALQEPGTYRYFCIPHESGGMKGTIVVKG